MKLTQLLYAAAVIAALAMLAGCQQEKASNESDLSDAGKQVQESVGEAVESTKQFAAETKEEAVAAVQKGLDQMDAKIDNLAQHSGELTGEAKTKADEALSKLRAQRDAAAKKLEGLEAATKDTWRDAKAGFDEAWQKLENTYEEVKDGFQG